MPEGTVAVQSVNSSAVADIVVEERMRQEFGNIDELANSIAEFGLIEPIVLATDIDEVKLVAGERRLRAIKRLGWTHIKHGEGGYIWLDESQNDPLRRKAIELEENLRRKELSWQEQALGRKQLLETMQALHGAVNPLGGARSNAAKAGVEQGFGVRRLAAMLGISPATVSMDIQVANAITTIPQLASAATREAVLRRLKTANIIVAMNAAGAAKPQGERLWTLHQGDFHANASLVPSQSVDLVYTDLPFGVDLSKMSKHDKGVVSYSDSRESVLAMLHGFAGESFRVLRDDRFLVVFFGFNYYAELCEALRGVRFVLNPVPVIWYKHTRSTENPNARYANAYDAALVAMKGSPLFMRPGQTNVVDIPAVLPSDKLQIAQQPVALVQRFIEDMTAPGATVLDWCAGSGTTGEAAVRLKRHAILFEKEKSACTLIQARLNALPQA